LNQRPLQGSQLQRRPTKCQFLNGCRLVILDLDIVGHLGPLEVFGIAQNLLPEGSLLRRKSLRMKGRQLEAPRPLLLVPSLRNKVDSLVVPDLILRAPSLYLMDQLRAAS